MLAAPKNMKRRSIHSGRLERWLGKEKIEQLVNNMRDGGGPGNRWYGEPIILLDVPGGVHITPDGDFVGHFHRGGFDSALDSLARHLRDLWKAAGRPIYLPEPVFGVGFASVSDALNKASSGYGQQLNGGMILKNGPTSAVGRCSTLWRLGTAPAAGAVGAAAPGGTVHDRTNTGAMTYNLPSTGTLHLVQASISASVANNSLMLYDRLFSVAKTMNATTTEAVTGVPTRYTNTTAGTADYIGGNFLTIEVGGTALAATAHNWTVCQYTNQAGTAAQTLPSVTGVSGAIVDTLDFANGWFCPLATGDTGVKALTQMQCSAAVATGVISFVIGHALAWMAFPLSNMSLPFGWITDQNQTPRIFDGACLALMETVKNATTATNYTGTITALNAP